MSTKGRLFDDKFRIVDQIAQGDLASVYLATDLGSGEVCTLRLFNWDFSSDGSVISLLKQEAANVEKLRHPNIMPTGKIEQTRKGQVYTVRRFLEGRNLEDVLRLKPPLTLRRACVIGRQIASALEASHNAGILHGDLKPANILLIEEENGMDAVRVLGFGTFPLKRDRFMDLAHLALHDPDHLIGSARYISPERAIGTEPDALDGRSDLYSLGVILYEMLSGESPFRGSTPMELLLAHLFDEPQPLRERVEPALPEVLDTLVMRTLAKNRKDRPPSATVLVDQLQAWAKYEAAGSQAPEVGTVPQEDATEASQGILGNQEPVSRFPFVHAPKIQPQDSTPAAQPPSREIAAKAPQPENPQSEPLWSSQADVISEPKGARHANFPPAAANSERPQAQNQPAEGFWSSKKEEVEEPEPVSRLPFVYVPKGQPQEFAPTLQLPIRNKAVETSGEQSQPESRWSSSGIASSGQKGSAPGINFPASGPKAEPASPEGRQTKAFGPSRRGSDSDRQAPAHFAEFPAPLVGGGISQAQSPQTDVSHPFSFMGEMEKASSGEANEVVREPLLKAPVGSPGFATPERQPAEPHSFVADLNPTLPPEGEKRKKTIADITLGNIFPPKSPVLPAADAPGKTSTVFVAPSPAAEAAQGPRHGHSAWLAAILVILIAAGGGSGWLYYTGRTYWFQPQYVLLRVSSLFASESPASARSSQPAGASAPSNANAASSAPSPSSSQPSSVQGPQRTSSATAAPSASTSSHPLSSPGSAGAQGTDNSIQALKTPSLPQAVSRLPSSASHAKVQPPHSQTEDSTAVEDAIRRGNYYFLLGKYDAAIRIYDAALKQSPANPRLLEEIARAKRAKSAEAEFLGH
jgi:serine/threonine protein kinase